MLTTMETKHERRQKWKKNMEKEALLYTIMESMKETRADHEMQHFMDETLIVDDEVMEMFEEGMVFRTMCTSFERITGCKLPEEYGYLFRQDAKDIASKKGIAMDVDIAEKYCSSPPPEAGQVKELKCNGHGLECTERKEQHGKMDAEGKERCKTNWEIVEEKWKDKGSPFVGMTTAMKRLLDDNWKETLSSRNKKRRRKQTKSRFADRQTSEAPHPTPRGSNGDGICTITTQPEAQEHGRVNVERREAHKKGEWKIEKGGPVTSPSVVKQDPTEATVAKKYVPVGVLRRNPRPSGRRTARRAARRRARRLGDSQLNGFAIEVDRISRIIPLGQGFNPLDDFIHAAEQYSTQHLRAWFQDLEGKEKEEAKKIGKEDYEGWGVVYARWGLYEHNAMFFGLHHMRRNGEHEAIEHAQRTFYEQRYRVRCLLTNEDYRHYVNPLQYSGEGNVRVQRTRERAGMRPTVSTKGRMDTRRQ